MHGATIDKETQNYQEQYNRYLRLRVLYKIDGREDPSHPDHRLFSGLHVNREEILKKATPEQIAEYQALSLAR